MQLISSEVFSLRFSLSFCLSQKFKLDLGGTISCAVDHTLKSGYMFHGGQKQVCSSLVESIVMYTSMSKPRMLKQQQCSLHFHYISICLTILLSKE